MPGCARIPTRDEQRLCPATFPSCSALGLFQSALPCEFPIFSAGLVRVWPSWEPPEDSGRGVRLVMLRRRNGHRGHRG